MEYSPNFPRTLEEFRVFISEHLFNVEEIDDALCSSVIEKINTKNYSFSDAEIAVMRRISNIGDVCTCDTDHRIGEDGTKYAIANE